MVTVVPRPPTRRASALGCHSRRVSPGGLIAPRYIAKTMALSRWTILAALTGLLALAVSVGWKAGLFHADLLLTDWRRLFVDPSLGSAQNPRLGPILAYTIWPAMIENLLFPVVYGLVAVLRRWLPVGVVLFLSLIGATAYVLHGGAPDEFGRALAFILMGTVFWYSRADVGLWGAYGLTVLSHLVWNSGGMLLWYVAQ